MGRKVFKCLQFKIWKPVRFAAADIVFSAAFPLLGLQSWLHAIYHEFPCWTEAMIGRSLLCYQLALPGRFCSIWIVSLVTRPVPAIGELSMTQDFKVAARPQKARLLSTLLIRIIMVTGHVALFRLLRPRDRSLGGNCWDSCSVATTVTKKNRLIQKTTCYLCCVCGHLKNSESSERLPWLLRCISVCDQLFICFSLPHVLYLRPLSVFSVCPDMQWNWLTVQNCLRNACVLSKWAFLNHYCDLNFKRTK